jgi:hypothetical protein
MLDLANNIGEVERVSAAFPWAFGALVLMAASGLLLIWRARRQVEQSPDDAYLASLKRP